MLQGKTKQVGSREAGGVGVERRRDASPAGAGKLLPPNAVYSFALLAKCIVNYNCLNITIGFV